MQLSHRAGNITDHGFICSNILNGARKGHFAIELSDRQATHLLKKTISDMLLPDTTEQVYVFFKNNERIGFAILTNVEAHPLCRELYVVCVITKFRGLGYGRQIMAMMMQKLQPYIVYARCAPASQQMARLLTHHSFQLVHETDQGERVFKRDNLQQNDIYLGSTRPRTNATDSQALHSLAVQPLQS